MVADPTKANAPTDLVGLMLGEFKVLRLIGRGGMGDVYEAEQARLGRKVALKILREDLVKDPLYLKRFEEEARAVGRFNHPNIVSIITIGEQSGIHYIAMEFVDGRTLRDHIRRNKGMDEKEVVVVLKKTAAALQRAHEEGIVHRDIKPENILLTRRTPTRGSDVKVADFGLARSLHRGDAALTQSGMTMGTPLYMSPEQVRNTAVDHRTDIYSLGVTAYHMLAGEPPYSGDSPLAVAVQHVQGNATPLDELRPDVSKELRAIVTRMMAVRPEDRFQSSVDLIRELSRLRPGGSRDTFELAVEIDDTEPSPPIQESTKPDSTRLSRTVSRISNAVGDRKRIHWTLPLSLVIALAGGAGVAIATRERDPFSMPFEEKARKRPQAGDKYSLPDAKAQLKRALELKTSEKELALWSVVDDWTSDDVEENTVLDASVALLQYYIDRRDYPRIEELGRSLTESDKGQTAEQKTYGWIFRGIAAARASRPEDALEYFNKALGGEMRWSYAHYSPTRIESLAREVAKSLMAISDSVDAKTLQGIKDGFLRRLAPPSLPGRPLRKAKDRKSET